MPLLKSKDVGANMESIKAHNPGWSKKQKIAVALSQAREAGADIPEKRKKVRARLKRKADEA